MSDGKEVKRWETISIDTKISGTMLDVDGVPRVTVVSASDHDRIVAELKAEVEVLKNHRAEYEADCKRIEYFDDLHDKAARQAKVIEKLRERLTSWISETHPNDEHLRNMCLMAEERELEAIEQGEGT